MHQNLKSSFKSVDTKHERPRQLIFIKIFALAFLGVLFNVLAIANFLKLLKTPTISLAFATLGFSFLFLILILLDVFFIKNIFILFFVALFNVLSPFVLFYSNLIPSGILEAHKLTFYVIVSGFVIFFASLFGGLLRGKGILDNGVSVKFFMVVKPILAKAVFGLLVLLTALSYLAYFQWGFFNNSVGADISYGILKSANPALSVIYPGTSFDDSLSVFLPKVAETELKKLSAKKFSEASDNELNLDLLSPSEREKIIATTALSIKTNLEKVKLIGPLQSSEKLSDIVYRLANKYFSGLYLQYGKTVFSLAFTLFIFFFLKSILILFYWLIEFVAFIIFKLFFILGFARSTIENTQKEVIEL